MAAGAAATNVAGHSKEKSRALLARLLKERSALGETYPLSFAQQRLWFLYQVQPDNSAYNTYRALRIRGSWNYEALAASLREIVRRHAPLRTHFATVDGKPVQVISREVEFPLPVVDIGSLPSERCEAETERLVRQGTQAPFDLGRSPLLRATLLRLDAGEAVVFMAMHHIISDGWSGAVVVRELAALYAAALTGCPSPLAELPIEYTDYVHWQRQWLSGPVLDAEIGYWKKQLAQSPAVLELPADRPRPRVRSTRGASLDCRFTPALHQALESLAREEGATLFMVLMAAFKVLLYRQTAQRDLLVGTVVAGRNRRELEGLIGFFVNTLVLRTNLSGEPSFRQLVARVRRTVVEVYAHQELPFAKLVAELQPERTMSHSPLYQVSLTLLNAPPQTLELPGARVSLIEPGRTAAQVDLSVELRDDMGWLGGLFEYSRDLFDRTTMWRLRTQFERLLEAAVAAPEKRLSELPLLAEAERHQLTDEWNDTDTDVAPPPTLCAAIEQWARQAGDAVAISFEGSSLSYTGLDVRANRLASYLRQLGVGPEARVAVAMERCLEMVISLLAVLKAGGAYVPLDPGYPEERLAFMIADSQPAALLAPEPLGERISALLKQPIPIFDPGATVALREEPEPDLIHLNRPEHMAYVIYTSGSTGRPKGVQIVNRAIVNFLRSMAEQPGLGREDVLVAVTSMSFDIAGLEIFLPLVQGARVVLMSRDTASDGIALAACLERSRVTVLQATPATWQILLSDGWGGLPRLKALCGGEALLPDLARRLLERVGQLWNVYGPTETTVWSSLLHLVPGEPVKIGRPIANTEVHVLGRNHELVSVGVVGELLIGGRGLARGYLRRPALTAERFVANPFSGTPGKRLYRTGDLARFRPDGTIECLGRIDHQVKVRGYRIELGEIEAALNRHPAVREVAARVHVGHSSDSRIVGYITTPAGDPQPSSDALRVFLKGRLPEYMVPAVFVHLQTMPLTPNGKIDRRALPSPEWTPSADYAAPETPLEQWLTSLWGNLLDLGRVGINDNFFDLGGHSLLGLQIMSRIREAHGVEIPLPTLFEAPTIAELAALISEKQGDEADSAMSEITRLERGRPRQALEGLDELSEDEMDALLAEMTT